MSAQVLLVPLDGDHETDALLSLVRVPVPAIRNVLG